MRGFTDEERARIREELLDTGYEMLMTYGPEKTTVADVTEPVGIAKGTFYRFFDSKAELYLEIVLRELDAYIERVEGELAAASDPRDGVERLLRSYVELIEGNPLLQRTMVLGDKERLFRGLDEETHRRRREERLAAILPTIETFLEGVETGRLAGMDATTLLGLLGPVGLLVTNREEYDLYAEDYFDRVLDDMIEVMAIGLTTPIEPA